MNASFRNCTVSATIGLFLALGCAGDRGSTKSPAVRQCGSLRPGEAHQTLLNRENVEAVEPLAEQPLVFRPTPLKTAAAEQKAKTVGVRIRMRPAFGLTAERLQLLATCDSMNVDPAAHDPNCPFAVKGTSVTVRSTGTGFAVEVESADPATVEELLRRSQALAGANGARTNAAQTEAP